MALHTAKITLIAGMTGSFGSHLCEHSFNDWQHDVLCVNKHFTGTRNNITHFLDNYHFEQLRHEITFQLCVEVGEICDLVCPEFMSCVA
jgi:UDP-glucuronate decarboxylase